MSVTLKPCDLLLSSTPALSTWPGAIIIHFPQVPTLRQVVYQHLNTSESCYRPSSCVTPSIVFVWILAPIVTIFHLK